MKQLSLFSLAHNEPEKVTHQWELFIDGAARSNPGPAGAGIYILKDKVFFGQKGFFLGNKTNNQAEYLALLVGMFVLKHYVQPDDYVKIASDSQLLVRQMHKQYKVRSEHLIPLFTLAQHLFKVLPSEIRHIRRELNEQADNMANKGIDSKTPLPKDFIALLHTHDIHL